jgi:hypothetical protein
MSLEDPGSVSFAGIGGLGDQVRELREVIELPLMNPELFEVSLYFLLLKNSKWLTNSEWVLNHPRVYYYTVPQELVRLSLLSSSSSSPVLSLIQPGRRKHGKWESRRDETTMS